MTLTAAYQKLNALLWMNRLPKATIVRVSDATLPTCYGLTIHDDLCVRPVILLNISARKTYGKTLIHEMLHVAEPQLPHGLVFSAIVDSYWKFSKTKIKDIKTL